MTPEQRKTLDKIYKNRNIRNKLPNKRTGYSGGELRQIRAIKGVGNPKHVIGKM